MAISIWVLLLLSLFFSALFSGMEIAFVSANKLKIELDNKQGKYSAKILSNFLKQPSKFISTMLLGNNIAIVVYSMIMAKIMEPLIFQYISINNFVILFLQTLISTLLVLFFAEFIPKAMLRKNPNSALTIAAIPLRFIYFVLYPLTSFTVSLSNVILKIFKVDTSEMDLAFSRVDLEHFVMDIQQRIELGEEVDNEIQIFKNALDFSEVKVRECMIPRTEVVAMNVEDTIENLQKRFSETGLSKILIYRDSIDNIIGYTHSIELFKKPKTIKSILLPISIIPEAMSANNVLQQFISQHRSLAVVVDEFGGTSGILTTEDIIEEIFGEIEDEHDKEDLIEIKISENEYQFSARLEIDYLNETYNLNLPEFEEFETLAGLIIHISENIPKKDEVVSYKNFNFKIDKVTENKIELITILIQNASN